VAGGAFPRPSGRRRWHSRRRRSLASPPVPLGTRRISASRETTITTLALTSDEKEHIYSQIGEAGVYTRVLDPLDACDRT
jgi:hypothetical protein